MGYTMPGIRLMMLAAGVSLLAGCAARDGDDANIAGGGIAAAIGGIVGDAVDAQVTASFWNTVVPKVVVLYPAVEPETVVPPNTSHEIKSDGACVTYFTVEVPYLTDDAKPSSGVHDLLHYVIGGYGPDNSEGRVLVNGVMTDSLGAPTHKSGDGAALITVDQGWVWVSDKPPSASALCGADPAISRGPRAPGGPDGGADSPQTIIWSGWSILTLLNAEWTWAGAIGTELIYRVAETGQGIADQTHTVYGLSATDSMIGWRPAPGDAPKFYGVQNGWYRRAKHGAEPSAPAPIQSGAAEKAFVGHIREQLEIVSVGARPDCR